MAVGLLGAARRAGCATCAGASWRAATRAGGGSSAGGVAAMAAGCDALDRCSAVAAAVRAIARDDSGAATAALLAARPGAACVCAARRRAAAGAAGGVEACRSDRARAGAGGLCKGAAAGRVSTVSRTRSIDSTMRGDEPEFEAGIALRAGGTGSDALFKVLAGFGAADRAGAGAAASVAAAGTRGGTTAACGAGAAASSASTAGGAPAAIGWRDSNSDGCRRCSRGAWPCARSTSWRRKPFMPAPDRGRSAGGPATGRECRVRSRRSTGPA